MPAERLHNQLEPPGLLAQFAAHPPEGFALLQDWPAPAFTAPFDLLTTADDALKARLLSLPGGGWLSRRLRLSTDFVGTTVSEMTAANEGIGYLLVSAGSSMQMGLAFAGLIVVGAMAMVMYELFSAIEKRTTGWARRGSQGE